MSVVAYDAVDKPHIALEQDERHGDAVDKMDAPHFDVA
jgi:hypothetical protein